MSDTWMRHHKLVTDERLRSWQAVTIERLTDQAIGYVWGFQDAGGEVKDTQRSTEFGRRYGIVAARFELAQIGSRPPIQDAWRSWQEHGEIRDYSGRRLDTDA